MVPCFVMLSGYRSVLTIGRTTGTDRSGGINGVIAPEPFADDTTSTFPRWWTLFCALLGSTVDTRSSSVPGCCRKIFLQILVNVRLDSVVDSRLALQDDFPGLQHGEVCKVDAPIVWTARAYGTLNLDIVSSAPCIRQAALDVVSGLLEKSFSRV